MRFLCLKFFVVACIMKLTRYYMRLKVQEAPVRQNIELFLDLMFRSKEKPKQQKMPKEKIFDAWLNCETGQLLFAETTQESQTSLKPVRISYSYDPQIGEIVFLMEERQMPEKGFRSGDLSPIAFNIVRETMKMLNEISHTLRGPSDLETKMSVLSKLHIESISHEERNILIDAWHHVDRFEAEELLLEEPAGTYLFRRDPFAEILEEQLQQQLKEPLKCFTLTFSQPHKKISDITLIHYDGGWQYYDDDPSLGNRSFQN